MMLARFGLVLLASALATSSIAAEPQQPTGKWIVEYAEKMCVLQRSYGTEQRPLTLAFRPDPFSGDLTVYFLDKPTRQFGAYVDASVGFGPGKPVLEKKMATFDVRERRFRLNELWLTRQELEPSSETGVLSINAKKRIDVSLKVPELAKALGVLDDCVIDLMESWGFSREKHGLMAQRAQPLKPHFEYVSHHDYPNQALTNNESGANSVRYWIDTSGRPRDCQIVESSRSTSLDAAICRVVKRIRYRPALDRSGKPMESIGFMRLRWRLQ
jgi:TonB family protein